MRGDGSAVGRTRSGHVEITERCNMGEQTCTSLGSAPLSAVFEASEYHSQALLHTGSCCMHSGAVAGGLHEAAAGELPR